MARHTWWLTWRTGATRASGGSGRPFPWLRWLCVSYLRQCCAVVHLARTALTPHLFPPPAPRASSPRLSDVVGIPLVLVLILFVRRKRGTLYYPAVEFEGASIDPSNVEQAVRRTNEYFHNRVAYGSLYDQYEAQFWWCVLTIAIVWWRSPLLALTPHAFKCALSL